MLKIFFRSKGSGDARIKRRKVACPCKAMTSTPNSSARGCPGGGRKEQSPDLSLIQIERTFLEPIVVSDDSIADLEVSLLDEITRMQDNPAPGQGLPTFTCTCSGLECVCAGRRNGPSSRRESDQCNHLQSSPQRRVKRCLVSDIPCPGSLNNSPRTDCTNRRCDKRPGTPRPSPTSSCLNLPVACPGRQKNGSKPPSPSSSLSPRKIPPCQSKVTPQIVPCNADSNVPCTISNCPTLRPDSSATSSRYHKPLSEQNFKVIPGKNCLKNSAKKSEKNNEESSGIFGLLQKLTAWSPIALLEGSNSPSPDDKACPRGSEQDLCPGFFIHSPGESDQESPCRVTSTPCSQRPRVSFQTPECGQVEQLYFNEGIKKSDASLEFEPCSSGTCQESQQHNEMCGLDACGALNSTYPVENEENLNMTCGSLGGSGGGAGGSGAGGSESARAQQYHNKLLATLQILQNKEETVRVQSESLGVAEARIAQLTVRAQQMKRDLDHKQQQINELKRAASRGSQRKPAVDSYTSTHNTETEVTNQRATVISLQKNIALIEELYRECFYESAKQEELIDLLRKSYLDVRLMEKEKADRERETHNHNVNTHVWTLKRCQEIATEVENLKIEITNFVGSPNNDSGMWTGSEDSTVTEVGEDLQDITDQLLKLRDLLVTGECRCGSQAENQKLKEEKESIEREKESVEREKESIEQEKRSIEREKESIEREKQNIERDKESIQRESDELRARICHLEQMVLDKDNNIRRCKQLLDDKQEQLLCAQCEISTMKERNAEAEKPLKCLAKQAKQAEDSLKKKCLEIEILSQKCCEHENTIAQLRQELAKADIIIKENCKIRNEVSYLTQQVSLWRSQLGESEARVRSVELELTRARSHALQMDQCYREKACSAAALQEQLEAAHARGGELCGEARRVVCAVRHWVRRMRDKHADQDRQIRQQAAVIAALNRQLTAACPDRVTLDARPAETSIGASVCCSKCAARVAVDEETDATCSAIQRLEMLTQSQEDQRGMCECRDRAACVDHCTAHASPPPLQDGGPCHCAQDGGHQRCECRQDGGGSIDSISTGRRKKTVKKKTCGESHCAGGVRSAAEQRPTRSSAGTYFPPAVCQSRSPSPTQELYERVERLQVALVDGTRRWSRTRLPVPKRP